ncbi:MAG: hypothetical protein ACR2IK_13240 [Chloroflexota bacterium]
MFDSLNQHMLAPYATDTFVDAPNFARVAAQTVTFDNFYAGSMPDPGQERLIVDDELELRMLHLLAQLMRANDAPRSQFERLGIPYAAADIGSEHLLVRVQAQRAAATAEPLPSLAELPARDLLSMPIVALLQDARTRRVLEQHAPGLVRTELVAAAAQLNLLDLASVARVPAVTLRALAEALALEPVR